MLHAKAEDSVTIHLIEGAAAGMIATVDSQGPEALEDWEVNELLDWTTSLNFDEWAADCLFSGRASFYHLHILLNGVQKL